MKEEKSPSPDRTLGLPAASKELLWFLCASSPPLPSSFFCFWGRHVLNSLPFLTHLHFLNPYPFHESHWRFLPMKCSDLFSNPMTFLGHLRLALSPSLSDIASWSILTFLTPPSWASSLWSHHDLCSLPEQTVLHSQVKSFIPADTTSLLSQPLILTGPQGVWSSQFYGCLKIKIAWAIVHSFAIQIPSSFHLLCFSTLLHSAQKPRLA